MTEATNERGAARPTLTIVGDHSRCERCNPPLNGFRDPAAQTAARMKCKAMSEVQSQWRRVSMKRERFYCRACEEQDCGALPLPIRTRRTQCVKCDLREPREGCKCRTEFTLECARCAWALTSQYNGFAVDEDCFVKAVRGYDAEITVAVDFDCDCRYNCGDQCRVATLLFDNPSWACLRDGSKTVEIRAATPDLTLRAGDTVRCVSNSGNKLLAQVTGVSLHPAEPNDWTDRTAASVAKKGSIMYTADDAYTKAQKLVEADTLEDADVNALALPLMIEEDARRALREFFETEDLSQVLPRVASLEGGVELLLQKLVPEEVARHGLLAIHLCVRGESPH